MCTGTLILNAKAQLFSMLMLKKRKAIYPHFVMGTLGLRRPSGESVTWDTLEVRVVKQNWRKVISRPAGTY